MKAIIMPKFGFTQDTADVVEWLVKEGDRVDEGDPILEVTTDKVNMEVEAPESGILAGIRVQAGETVPVTEIIAYILQPGESLPEIVPNPTAKPSVKKPIVEPKRLAPATPVAARIAQESDIDLSKVKGSGNGGRITKQDVLNYAGSMPATDRVPTEQWDQQGQPNPSKDANGAIRATPAARRVAREKSIDLALILGTGPRQRIQEADVLNWRPVEQPASQPVEPKNIGHVNMSRMMAETDQPPTAGSYVIPLTNMRRAIGKNLSQSWQQAPHIFFEMEIDMSNLLALLAEINSDRGDRPKLSVTPFLTRAVAATLEKHPYLRSSLAADRIVIHPEIDIGIAVALEDGLIVPVVRNAALKGIRQIGAEIRELATLARKGALKADQLSNGRFTISNLGMYDLDAFTAIINPGQAAILAVAATKKRFVPDENDQPVLKPISRMTLSVDHRIIDGALAAAFMHDLKRVIERPIEMIL